MNIATFSFVGSRAGTLMYRAREQDSCYMVYGSNTSFYESFLYHETPDIIIGFWDYTGVDTEFLRIESYCTNKWRNDLVESEVLQKYDLWIPSSIPDGFKIGNGMGNGHCNHSCYKILQFLETEKMPTKLGFIHIPKTYGDKKAVREMDGLMKEMKK